MEYIWDIACSLGIVLFLFLMAWFSIFAWQRSIAFVLQRTRQSFYPDPVIPDSRNLEQLAIVSQDIFKTCKEEYFFLVINVHRGAFLMEGKGIGDIVASQELPSDGVIVPPIDKESSNEIDLKKYIDGMKKSIRDIYVDGTCFILGEYSFFVYRRSQWGMVNFLVSVIGHAESYKDFGLIAEVSRDNFQRSVRESDVIDIPVMNAPVNTHGRTHKKQIDCAMKASKTSDHFMPATFSPYWRE